MTIDATKMAQQSRRKAAPTVNVATEEQLAEALELIDELAYRVLDLEVKYNQCVTEINHHNAWLHDFRSRHEVLYNLPWYRLYIWLTPHMGLPHFFKRDKLKAIRIRDTPPRPRKNNG